MQRLRIENSVLKIVCIFCLMLIIIFIINILLVENYFKKKNVNIITVAEQITLKHETNDILLSKRKELVKSAFSFVHNHFQKKEIFENLSNINTHIELDAFIKSNISSLWRTISINEYSNRFFSQIIYFNIKIVIVIFSFIISLLFIIKKIRK